MPTIRESTTLFRLKSQTLLKPVVVFFFFYIQVLNTTVNPAEFVKLSLLSQFCNSIIRVTGQRSQLLWLIPRGCNMEKEQGSDNMISYAKVVSVSTLCSRCSNFMFSSCSMTCFSYRLYIDSLWLVYIYSVNTILYPYALPLESIPILISSLCLSVTWAL